MALKTKAHLIIIRYLKKKKCFTEFCLKYSRTKIASTLIYFCDGGAHKPSSHPPRASAKQKAFILRSGNIATPTRPLHRPGTIGRKWAHTWWRKLTHTKGFISTTQNIGTSYKTSNLSKKQNEPMTSNGKKNYAGLQRKTANATNSFIPNDSFLRHGRSQSGRKSSAGSTPRSPQALWPPWSMSLFRALQHARRRSWLHINAFFFFFFVAGRRGKAEEAGRQRESIKKVRKDWSRSLYRRNRKGED